MLFNSLQYLCFFLVVLALNWLLGGRQTARIWVILIASFYFYASNNGWLIVLLFICMQIDFVAARWIEAAATPARKKLYLAVSMASNIGMLAFFKYCNFCASS